VRSLELESWVNGTLFFPLSKCFLQVVGVVGVISMKERKASRSSLTIVMVMGILEMMDHFLDFGSHTGLHDFRELGRGRGPK
jgi:hypothetical protein